MTARLEIGIVLVVVVIALILAHLSEVVVSIDQDGPPVPDWLPPTTTDLHLRGTRHGCGFSGRCAPAEWTSWVERSRLPLRERRQGALSWDDYGATPASTWFRSPTARPVRREVGEGEELVFGDADEWPGDRPFLSIHYHPASGILYGKRIDP